MIKGMLLLGLRGSPWPSKDLDAGEPKAHTLHGDELDYEQKEERKERSYSGSGKPNSISSTDWKAVCEGYTSRLKGRKL